MSLHVSKPYSSIEQHINALALQGFVVCSNFNRERRSGHREIMKAALKK